MNVLTAPWPWYVTGLLAGLMVPALLLLGNKKFGISSSLRHVCAACMPAKIPFFSYDWKKEVWNLYFVGGVLLGGLIAGTWLTPDGATVALADATRNDLSRLGITEFGGLMPTELFNWDMLLTPVGFVFFVIGGFLVGFGTRWAGGCTSGHTIMGLSNLQWPSLVATIGFFIGGLLSVHLLLPLLLS